MIKYQRNNILFRIASSDAIDKFKTGQAHAFVQIARKEIDFDDAARETVLLEYDRLSQWIFRIERICQAAPEGKMAPLLYTSIMESLREELRIVEGIMESHTEIFSPEVAQFVRLIHGYSMGVIYERGHDTLNSHIETSFSKMVQIVAEYLQHLLISLHEFNNNIIRKKKPFLCAIDFCLSSYENQHRFNSMKQRAQYFTNNGCDKTFVFKNYTTEDIFHELQALLSKDDISLVPEDRAGKA